MNTANTPPSPEPRAQICEHIEASISVKRMLLEDAALLRQIQEVSEACLGALRTGGKIVLAGNGGSFADAQHLAAEFTCRFTCERAPLAAIALGTNGSGISAIANDYGYEQVFARELRALACPSDVFIGISTSGNSPNVLAAVDAARSMRLVTYGFTGRTGGKLKQHCDCLCVPSDETARIQECHILIGHIVCSFVEAAYAVT